MDEHCGGEFADLREIMYAVNECSLVLDNIY